MAVTFYILTALPSNQNELRTSPAHFGLACQLCADLYRAKQRVFVYTADQEQAEAFDQQLWQFDAERFVPHNLSGEGPSYGAAVEIGWQTPKHNRPVLINLTEQVPDFAQRFKQIIEFVPAEEHLKAQARERYKQYRQHGITPSTITID